MSGCAAKDTTQAVTESTVEEVTQVVESMMEETTQVVTESATDKVVQTVE